MGPSPCYPDKPSREWTKGKKGSVLPHQTLVLPPRQGPLQGDPLRAYAEFSISTGTRWACERSQHQPIVRGCGGRHLGFVYLPGTLRRCQLPHVQLPAIPSSPKVVASAAPYKSQVHSAPPLVHCWPVGHAWGSPMTGPAGLRTHSAEEGLAMHNSGSSLITHSVLSLRPSEGDSCSVQAQPAREIWSSPTLHTSARQITWPWFCPGLLCDS